LLRISNEGEIEGVASLFALLSSDSKKGQTSTRSKQLRTAQRYMLAYLRHPFYLSAVVFLSMLVSLNKQA
jgi:hypothetical protein